MHGCVVCVALRDPRLSASQIEWHNIGHPGIESLGRVESKKFCAAVIIRPGDQILYEIKPAKDPKGTCHYRKLDPNVLMMYSSEERMRGNLPDALNASSDRCVLAQGEVSPHLILKGSV
jgi:hypothetical protein